MVEIVRPENFQHDLVELLEVVSKLLFVLDLSSRVNQTQKEKVSIFRVVMTNRLIKLKK